MDGLSTNVAAGTRHEEVIYFNTTETAHPKLEAVVPWRFWKHLKTEYDMPLEQSETTGSILEILGMELLVKESTGISVYGSSETAESPGDPENFSYKLSKMANQEQKYLGRIDAGTTVSTTTIITIKPIPWYEKFYSFTPKSDLTNSIFELISRIDSELKSSNFREVDAILRDLEYPQLRPELMMAFLRITHRAKNHLPAWSNSLSRVREILTEKGEDVDGLLIGLD